MEIEGYGPLRKDQVIETIIAIFVNVVGFVERKDVSAATNPVKDFQVDTDDLSLFIAEVQRCFQISASQSEWFSIDGTIDSVADLVLRHSRRKLDDPMSM